MRVVINLQDANVTTGRSADQLRQVTWAQLTGRDTLEGLFGNRVALLRDFAEQDIRAEVRLKPAAFARWKHPLKDPKRAALAVTLNGVTHELTDQWTSVRPGWAFRLWQQRSEDHTLGAGYSIDTWRGDRLVIDRVEDVDLFEFRLPGDVPALAAAS